MNRAKLNRVWKEFFKFFISEADQPTASTVAPPQLMATDPIQAGTDEEHQLLINFEAASKSVLPTPPTSLESSPQELEAPAPVAAAPSTVTEKPQSLKRRRTNDESDDADAEPPKPKRQYKAREQKPEPGQFAFAENITTNPGEHVNVVRKVKVKKDADPKGKTEWEGGKFMFPSYVAILLG